MATTIVTKNGSGVPLDTDLVQGELAIDLENKRIYSKDPNDEIVQLGSDIDIPDGVEDDDMLLWSNTDDKWTTSEYVPSTEFSTSPPVNPKTGMLWQDTTPDEQALYCWDGSAWFEIVGANGHDGGDAKQIWSEVTEDGDIYYNKCNVGIGTENPVGGAAKVVDVYGSSSSAVNFHNDVTGVTATDGCVVGLYGNDLSLFNYEAGIIQFGTSNTEQMRINADGNVGIGTDDPQKTFVVSSSGGIGYEISPADSNYSTDGTRVLSFDRLTDDYKELRTDAESFSFVSGTRNAHKNALTIDADGTVGIPSGYLDVLNTGKIDSAGINFANDAYFYSHNGGNFGQVFCGVHAKGSDKSLDLIAGQNVRMSIDTNGRVDITGSLYVNGTPKIGYSELITTLVTLRNATQDETTLEGLRDSIGNAIGGLIEKFEHEIATMPVPEPEASTQ